MVIPKLLYSSWPEVIRPLNEADCVFCFDLGYFSLAAVHGLDAEFLVLGMAKVPSLPDGHRPELGPPDQQPSCLEHQPQHRLLDFLLCSLRMNMENAQAKPGSPITRPTMVTSM